MTNIERVLITGGCGFIGANLVRFLRANTPWAIRVVDDLRVGDPTFVDDGLAEMHVGNVADPSLLMSALDDIQAVIHLASQTGVLPSIEDPERDFQGNAVTTFRVLEGCRKRGIDRVIFASSGAVLGDVSPPLNEQIVPRPVSPYGAGKLVGEAYCHAYAGSFGIHTVALRFSNVYGPFSAHKRSVVPNFIKRCLGGQPIEIYGDGSQTRDFIYVDDLCAGIMRSLMADGIGGEIFQLASGVETSVLELAHLIQQAVGRDNEINFEPGRPGEVYRSRADISKARRALGFDVNVSLPDGLEETVAWYRDHWAPT
jgi:UDP-glucose 4-epimerase